MTDNPENPSLDNSNSSPPAEQTAQNGDDVPKTNGNHVQNGGDDNTNASDKESENANNNKSESESEEEPAPLFEQEEVIPEGSKRKRNSTVRLTDQISNIEKEKEVLKNSKPKEENLGKGSQLLHMSKVKQAITDLEKDKKHDDIKTLYKFCTGTGTVKASEVRQKLLRFKGLPFTSEDQKRVEKHEEILGLYPTASLNWCMKVFGIPKPAGQTKQVEVTDKETGEKKTVSKHYGPDKDTLIVACMEWLYCPKAVKPVKPKAKKVVKKKPQKPKQSEKRKNNEKNKTASPTKKQKPDKTSQLYDDNDDSSDDDKPLKPAIKKAPGKKELRRCIQKLLKKADLEVVTMKVMCNMVYDAFPDHREHVMNKKADIKVLIKEYISQQ